jgi:amino acid transporter/mannitol/fructose-specific phosphotransferase system IIA component (Ntr-type)
VKLKRELGFVDVFCIAAGAMISSGIFVLPGLAFRQAGPAVIVSYFLAGLLALLGILNIIELATAMPKAGGDYYYVTRSLGPLVGTASGLLGWFALSLKTAFAIYGLAAVLHSVTGAPLVLSAAAICLLFTCLNIRGVAQAAKLEVALVAALLLILAFYFAVGTRHLREAYYHPFAPHGLQPVFLTAGLVFVSFGGLLKVTSISEEVRDPTRNIPLGMLVAVVAISLLYTAVLFVTVGVVPAARLAGSLAPLSDAARLTAGAPGYWLTTVAAVLAFVTTANAGIMAASRYPLALGRDQLVPGILSRVTPRYGTPTLAIVITGTTIFLLLLLPLEILVKAASTVILTAYVLSSLAVIILRQSKLQNYRPTFRVPLYPWTCIAGLVLFLLLIIHMGGATIELSLGLVLASLLVYFFYGRRSTDQEYALMYLVRSITSRALVTASLETELREVVHERDQIQHDEFDEIIKHAETIDIKEPVDRTELFTSVSRALAPRLALAEKALYRGLIDREHETSTVISPFVAIPHVVVKESGRFEVALVRCREGVAFSAIDHAVKAVFVIVGSRDRRNLHLRALAAIAHVVQHPDFEDRWLNARQPEQLRDIFLLSRRIRRAAPAGEPTA